MHTRPLSYFVFFLMIIFFIMLGFEFHRVLNLPLPQADPFTTIGMLIA